MVYFKKVYLLCHCFFMFLLIGCEANSPTKNISDGNLNGFDYIDLGLSVKWATCNIGAKHPEEYGNYYAWGETKPKSIYHWSTYKFCDGEGNKLTKYNYDHNYGCVDNLLTLFSIDDAAFVNLGDGWRLPTSSEMEELRDSCTWKWTKQEGVYGYKVTSNKKGYTGKSIFLPAAGYQNWSTIDYVGVQGHYWVNRLFHLAPVSAYEMHFESNTFSLDYALRCYGRSIRPVCK